MRCLCASNGPSDWLWLTDCSAWRWATVSLTHTQTAKGRWCAEMETDGDGEIILPPPHFTLHFKWATFYLNMSTFLYQYFYLNQGNHSTSTLIDNFFVSFHPWKKDSGWIVQLLLHDTHTHTHSTVLCDIMWSIRICNIWDTSEESSNLRSLQTFWSDRETH